MSGLVHEKSVPQTNEWFTPGWIFEGLGLRFDLDPCHPGKGTPGCVVPCDRVYTEADDGITKTWGGRVWLNPPYGKNTPLWLAKMAMLARTKWDARSDVSGVALVFSRTDTAWFHNTIAKADAVLFLKQRVRFVDSNGVQGGSPGCGSLLAAWGPVEARALQQAHEGMDGFAGTLWRPTPPFLR